MAQTKNPWAALLVLCLGFFVILLDTTIVNVAIPTMLSALHAGLDQILWVVNAYLLTLAVLLITGARVGDIFGQRNLFIGGLGLFVLASTLCGLSQDANQLIAARVLQGVGAAILSPQSLVIVSAIFPAERRGAALGILSSVTGLAAIAGPTLGGVIVTYLDWRWIFFVNLPIGVAAMILALRFVPDLRPGRSHSLDLVGVLLASLGLFGVVFGLIEGQRYEWGAIAGSPVTIPMVIAAGLVIFGLFLLWERFQAEPLLPLSLFRNRNYSVMVWLSGLIFFGMFGFFLTTTIFMQSVLGFSAIEAGLTTVPLTLTLSAVAPFAGRLTDRFGGRYILMGGAGLFAVGIAGIAAVASLNATPFTFIVPLAIAGLGMGSMIAPIMTEAMHEISPQMAGAASGLLNTARQLGAAIGAAVVGAVLSNQLATSLHTQAVSASAQLPAQFRPGFVGGFTAATKGGLAVGRGQSGGTGLPAGVPPQAVHLVQQLIHQVFTNGFLTALRPTLAVPAAALALGAVSCLLIVRRTRPAVADLSMQPLELAS
ncbi:MAG TPA: DHA2 family efflux MFS transporter permease subunit [Candidatus Dormibacteraeota bacterium]